jgi:hypothetical protein
LRKKEIPVIGPITYSQNFSRIRRAPVTEKIYDKDVSQVFISVLDDAENFACGVEIMKDGEVYVIMSLYLDKADYPSKRQVLPHLYRLVFEYIPSTDKLISFLSPLRHFGIYQEQIRKAAVFAGGRKTTFRRMKNAKKTVKMLALDAIKRKTNIMEEI